MAGVRMSYLAVIFGVGGSGCARRDRHTHVEIPWIDNGVIDRTVKLTVGFP